MRFHFTIVEIVKQVVDSSMILERREMDIIEIAHGGRPLKLEDRLLKAIANIDEALQHTKMEELDRPLPITGRAYLANQKCLLQALLASGYW